MASTDDNRAFSQAQALVSRLLVEIRYNPHYKDHDGCTAAVDKFYAGDSDAGAASNIGWRDFTDKWLAGDAEVSELNARIGQLNGIAARCLPNYKPSDAIRGVDDDTRHPVATAVSQAAPFGPDGHQSAATPTPTEPQIPTWKAVGLTALGMGLIGLGVVLGRR